MGNNEILTKLMLDESFLAWVWSGGKEDAEHWQQWPESHPGQREAFEEARKILLVLQEQKHQMPDAQKEALRQKVIHLAQTGQPQNLVEKPGLATLKRPAIGWTGIAAALLALVVFGFLLFTYSGSRGHEMRFHTSYGEIKVFDLPDGSTVTLNGNSSLKYAYHKNSQKPREAWLDGEGFFEVNKVDRPSEAGSPQPVKFVVHTNNLSINVLGTRFNVKSRSGNTQVVLEKGSISLNMQDREGALLMKPDELVEVKKGKPLVDQKMVEVRGYTAWKDGIINFDGASFEEIGSVLKDSYGYELHFVDSATAGHINLRGSFPAQNIDLLLQAIANVTHTNMKKKGKTVIYQ